MPLRTPPKALLALLCQTPLAALAALPDDATVKAVVDKHLIDNGQAKGVVVALVDAGGIRIVTAGAARAGVAVKPDDLFEVGSITKTFTALLLAIAEQRGELKLDDPVETFLGNGVRLRDVEDQPIRLVDLATHRAGLPRLAANMRIGVPADPYVDYTEADLLSFVASHKIGHVRNTQYAYSNIGFGLLGYVLTKAAKADSYNALLSQRVLRPLGMSSTTADAAQAAGRMVQPHDARGRAVPPWSFNSTHAGAGAIRSTALDMGRYVQAVAGTADAALAGPMTLATTAREKGPGSLNPVALAWLQVPLDQRRFLAHDGATAGSAATVLVDRASGEGVFMAANSFGRLFDVALHLLDRRHPIAENRFPAVLAVDPPVLARYAGNYRINDRMSVLIRHSGSTLTAQATGQDEFDLFAESATRFFAKVAPLTITFAEPAEGQAEAQSFVLEQGGARVVANRLSAARP